MAMRGSKTGKDFDRLLEFQSDAQTLALSTGNSARVESPCSLADDTGMLDNESLSPKQRPSEAYLLLLRTP